MFIHAEREFRIIKLLEPHPQIVQGVEYFGEPLRNRAYIVMERIVGQNMLDLVN